MINATPPRVSTLDLGFQHLPQLVAAFSVEGPSGVVLIETGPMSTLPTLLEALQSQGLQPSDISAVLVTHIHLDHAGAAGWWAQRGVPVYVHPLGKRHLIDPSRLMESAGMVYGDALHSLWGEMLPAPPEMVQEVADEGVLEVAGLTFRAWDTPGHAKHHHAWILGDLAFTGDVAGVRLPGYDFLGVTSAPPQFDLEPYLASISRLRNHGLKKLYLTHFGEVSDVEDHLEAYARCVASASRMVKEYRDAGFHDQASLQIAYRAWVMERAFQNGLPPEAFRLYEAANPSDMCADGLRLYWEKMEK